MQQIQKAIRKSISDDRLYKYLKLPNELRCLLVHDKDVEKSSASLTVSIGSLHDPEHANGLAHFLEHMLFLGTEKYPVENHYSKFVLSNGGQKNAATAEDYTYYYFDIKNECFDEAVDIFSHFFKSPLFTESCTEREMKAVDSEYRKNLSDDNRRLMQLQKSIIARKGSVLNRFSTGSMDTLNYPTVRQDLLKFHQDFYSSNLMNLVLVGKAPLEHLETIARDNFSEIQNKRTKIFDFSSELPIFDENSNQKLYRVVPNKNIKQLKIYWSLPQSEDLWRQKPNSYISHLLGHEGPNSLLSRLIQEGLGTALTSASTSRMMKAFDQMSVAISLTDKGEKEYKKVIELVYMYINEIKRQGAKRELFDEIAKKNKIDFDYKDKMRAIQYSQMLSNRMVFVNDEDMEQILWRPFANEIFDKEEIEKRLELLNPTNSFVLYTTLANKELGEKLQTEKYYGTQYCVEPFDQEFRNRLMSIEKENDISLGYPPRNDFLPENLTIKKKERDDGVEKPGNPKLISESNPLLWFKQDDTFERPNLQFFLKINTNDQQFPSTPQSQIFASLWDKCLDENLREISYMAQLAGIEYSVSSHTEYLEVSIGAYNDGYRNFLRELINRMQMVDITEEHYENIREKKIRAYENEQKSEPYQRVENRFMNYVLKHSREKQEILNSLKNDLTFETFKQMKQNWLKKLKLEWLVIGHIEEDEALNIVKECEQQLNYDSHSFDNTYESRLVQIPDRYVGEYEELNVDPNNPNSAILCAFQQDMRNEESFACNQLVFHILKEPFFNQLRTQEQLGYIVSSSGFILKRVLHGRFVVQSAVQTPDYLISRVNEFLLNAKDRFENLTEDELNVARRAIIKNLEQKDLSIWQEAGRLWHEIVEGDLEFDRNERKIKALEKIGKDSVVSYYNQMFLLNPKRINVKIYSQNHWNQKEDITKYQTINSDFYSSKFNIKTIDKLESPKIFKLRNYYYPRFQLYKL